jgi:hypothetical protein
MCTWKLFRVVSLCCLGVSFHVAAQSLAQTIPALTELNATTGPGPGDVKLAWHTPLFDDPDPAPGFDSQYEYRASDVYIDNTTWDSAFPFGGGIPPVGCQLDVVFQLDLGVNAEVVPQVIYWDKYYMHAYLSVWHFWTDLAVVPLHAWVPGQRIDFYVYDDHSNEVFSDHAWTGLYGHASVYTGDITDDPNWRLFTFVAQWQGYSVWQSHGLVIAGQSAQDSEQRYVAERVSGAPPAGSWSNAGGVYSGWLDGVQYEFYVPANAIAYPELPVMLYTPSQVPPPVGMNPGVPGAMVAFVLEKPDGPFLEKPINISMEYPPDRLLQYGGLGESSLEGYRYDSAVQRWVRLECSPIGLDRQYHRFTFGTDQLGLFAIAAETDADHDGLGDVEEPQRWGTSPGQADSDGDGLPDGDEAWFTFGDPRDPEKLSGEDQHGLGAGLNPGQGYYVAGRIKCGDIQSDVSNCVYVQAGNWRKGDMNCDYQVGFGDINPFVLALSDPAAYQHAFPHCAILNGDINQDGLVNFRDINPFVALLTGGASGAR